MTFEEVIEGLGSLEAEEFDLSNVNGRGMERLYELTEALLALPAPERAIPALFAVMERLSQSNLGSPGPLVHTLEGLTGYEEELLNSVRRHPTPLSVWMVNRILNTDLARERLSALLALLEMAATHPAASDTVRADVADFLRLQRSKISGSKP
jgi:hypothetical protein